MQMYGVLIPKSNDSVALRYTPQQGAVKQKKPKAGDVSARLFCVNSQTISCALCGLIGSQLVPCSMCSDHFHPDCVSPTNPRLPPNWACSKHKKGSLLWIRLLTPIAPSTKRLEDYTPEPQPSLEYGLILLPGSWHSQNWPRWPL